MRSLAAAVGRSLLIKVKTMNTRQELEGRLQEIQRTAAELPGHEADVAELHYALTRLSSWTTRTLNFLTTLEMQPEEKPHNDSLF